MYTDYETMLRMLRIAHAPRSFSPRRALFTDGLLSLATVVGAIDRLAVALDELRFPEYHEQPLGKPIYIVAAPRSGTTFLHRMMALDPQFTTFKLYQTFFPSITAYQVAARIARVNGSVGQQLLSLRKRIDESSFGGWAGKHDTGLDEDEEDEALFALAISTPAILLVLPFFEEFGHLGFVDQLPKEKRQKLADYYRACIQRHLYAHPGRTLLAKNVLLPGRFGVVTEALPDARFVHILRHPYEAIASMLSLFTIIWRWHSPELSLQSKEVRQLAQLGLDYYRYLDQKAAEGARAGDGRFVTIGYRELLEDPAARVREIYEHFGLTLSESVDTALTREGEKQRRFKSDHVYNLEQFGLTRDIVYSELRDVFERNGFDR